MQTDATLLTNISQFALVFMSSKQRAQKEIYDRVRTGCKEKRTGQAKFVVFHLLIGLIAVAVTVAFVVAPRIYRCA